jgi:molecular chaperone GrpE
MNMFKRKDEPDFSPDEAPDPAPESFENAEPQSGDAAEQVRQLTMERDEARGNLMRALADYQNYQRRALSNEQEAKKQGATSVLNSILPVLDHFDLALTQATPDDASRRIMDGVKVIRDELIKALERHGVAMLNPQPNDEFDPSKHSAIMQQEGEGIEPGHVSATFQPGYMLGDRVIRPAKVAVAPNAS